jgi:plastocyanin
MVAGDPRRPRPPRRSYPLAAYLPFTIMVAVPIILLILLVWLISSLIAPHRGSAPVPSTATPSATTQALAPLPTFTATAAHPGVSPMTATVLPARTPTRTPVLTATVSVTVAVGATPAGAPIGAATVFHGSHDRLWAFASITDVHAGDTVRFIWRDLSRNRVVENYPEPVQVNAARFQARMYAYLGNTPTQPFPQGQYRVEVYHNKALAGSRAFRIVP